MPQIDILGPVAGEKQIEPSVGVVVPPDGGVGIDPRRQARALGYAHEGLATLVAKELGASIFVEEQILEAVVVEVAPERAHRHPGTRAIDIRESHRGCDIRERPVAFVTVETIERTLAAVGDVDVLPAIAIEITDRD